MQNNSGSGTPWYMNGSSGGSINNTDLTVVQDEMYSEALAYKKCAIYADRFRDQTLRSMAQAHAEHHRQHFDALQNYLNSRQ